MNIKRAFWHLLYPGWWVKRYFPPSGLQKIEAAIKQSEQLHHGEIRFAVESSLPIRALWNDEAMHERSLEVFSLLRAWDTEQNTGVLIYVLLADREVEIVADRGINQHVSNDQWQAICDVMETAFKQGDFVGGVLNGIELISALLQRYFPIDQNGVCQTNPNELDDKPVVL